MEIRINNVPNVNFVDIEGGWFLMGSDDAQHPEDGEAPVRKVWVDSFSIASTAVTNADYLLFIESTGYKTLAENIGNSFVFCNSLKHTDNYKSFANAPWWKIVDGACWKNPEGRGSSVVNRNTHPVVHLGEMDLLAYCEWTQTRLLTEAEWEFAARGGLSQNSFPWGNILKKDGKFQANIWPDESFLLNREFPLKYGTMPVDSFDPNSFGLFNMTGNVWERVADKFTTLHSPRPVRNPIGPINGMEFVAKGGSFLCHNSYCVRYRTSSRQSLKANMTSGNIGFRVAKA